jgi:hypothetical protein
MKQKENWSSPSNKFGLLKRQNKSKNVKVFSGRNNLNFMNKYKAKRRGRDDRNKNTSGNFTSKLHCLNDHSVERSPEGFNTHQQYLLQQRAMISLVEPWSMEDVD